MKASAGSGKTFSLAREYIRLLLSWYKDNDKDNDNAHRHILAVTFTNKATDEMKSRIIEELSILADDPAKSDYHSEFRMFPSDAQLKEASKKALRAILDDYSAFSVCTIDKFFQRALRAFSKEIGHIGEYQIELDRESLVVESVDRLLDSVSDSNNNDLRQLLSAFSKEMMDAGGGFHLERDLQAFAKTYMSSAYSEKAKALGIDEKEVFSADNLSKLETVCKEICKKFDEDFKAAARRANDIVTGRSSCFSSNFSKLIDKYASYTSGKPLKFDSKTWEKAVDNIESAFKKSELKNAGAGTISAISSCVEELAELADLPYKRRCTAELLRAQICFFRIAGKLKEQYEALLADKNVLGLDDTNTILSDLISDTATPFVYEKLGVRFNHFLLDEFQDTSTVQWCNFLPLLKESISRAGYNLVVGDVKQSIYRWRAADWKILDSDVSAKLGRTVEHRLDANYRSAKGIIDFNNLLFDLLPAKLDAVLSAPSGTRKIADIYSDVKQKQGRSKSVPGSVDLTFCAKEDINANVVAAVNEALAHKFALKDIAILVRSKKTGGMLASLLTEAGIPVISNDALMISSCETVRKLTARLSVLDDPKDSINSYYAGEDFDPASLESCTTLSDTVEAILATLPKEDVARDTTYILAFMDLLHDFTQLGSNSLRAFLNYWKEEGVKVSISSPSGGDAVTITTIHKSKGLDYPYVIIPLPMDKTPTGDSWEPLENDKEFGSLERAIYKVGMSSSLENTLFADNFAREERMCEIDDLNTWYVAMTRASEAMHIITESPKEDLSWKKFNMAGALWLFVQENGSVFSPVPQAPEAVTAGQRYRFGTVSDKAQGKDKPESKVTQVNLEYRTFSGGSKATPRISPSANDFFAADGGDMYSSSQRVRGIVLHKIMENVFSPEDLRPAVDEALRSGLLNLEEAAEAQELLSGAIAAVVGRGWFPSDHSKILDERDIASDIVLGDGKHVVRPDRVVLKDDGVDIVDYKFAKPSGKYVEQVSEYVALYRRMGYTNVRGYLWYVLTSTIEEIL